MFTYIIFTIILLFAIAAIAVMYLLYLYFEADTAPIPDVSIHYIMTDDLSKSIVNLLDDYYSPFYPIKLTDHIIRDIGIDSLDVVDLLFDISQIAGIPLKAAALYEAYGRDPTVYQLIQFVKKSISEQKAEE